MNWIEITGAITGLVYVILEIRQKRAMWIVGALSALMYIVVFFNSSLYAAAILQFYYVVVSVYGWRKWGRISSEMPNERADEITVKLPVKRALYSLGAAAAGFVIILLILDNFSEDPYPGADAFVAVASMLATWWVSGKHIENWIVWIIADVAAAMLFFWQGLYATAILYVVYAIAAVAGYIHWRKFPVVLK
jgi:nicotinamide mononucleotide transporter